MSSAHYEPGQTLIGYLNIPHSVTNVRDTDSLCLNGRLIARQAIKSPPCQMVQLSLHLSAMVQNHATLSWLLFPFTYSKNRED